MVAVLKRQAEQESTSVYQAIIDAPGINADAIQCTDQPARLAQSGERLVPERQDVPETVSTQHYRPVRKAIHLFQIEALPIEAPQHHTPALRTEINRRDIACRHGILPPFSTNAMCQLFLTPQRYRHFVKSLVL